MGAYDPSGYQPIGNGSTVPQPLWYNSAVPTPPPIIGTMGKIDNTVPNADGHVFQIFH